jgi:hypothetical protein
MFDIKVNHEFTNNEVETYYDHMYAGNLTIKVNGKDVGEEWMHDVDDLVDTHYYDYYSGYYDNPNYDDLLVVRMACTDDCVCTFEQTELRK